MSGSEQDDAAMAEVSEPEKPLLRIVSPNATPEEVAALVTVFAAMGGEAEAPPKRRPEWQANHRKLRVTHPHGPGGWRSSGLPR